jgi:DNA-binding response OmpR family regulator
MKPTVAIVDDEQNILESLNDFLKRSEKFEIKTFINPEDAISGAKNGLYDLILLDIMMPQMDGIEFLRQVKESKAKTRVIMMTANSTQDRIIECRALQADDYLTKPFITLRDVENKVLDNLGL